VISNNEIDKGVIMD